jgi:hypothetical protein
MIMAERMMRVTRVLDCIPDDSGYKEYDACAGEPVIERKNPGTKRVRYP